MTILSIVYHEPDWIETKKCIEATGLPVHYVERSPGGIGSLTEAINRGVKEVNDEVIWIVTNCTFEKEVPFILEKNLGENDIIHPHFNSDHQHLREGHGIQEVPFVEFTAAMIRKSKWLGLDEKFPYWGQDLDYSYRVWKNGGNVLCDYTTTIGHTYIRNSKYHPVTIRRRQLRRLSDMATRKALEKKYGEEWRGIVFPKTPEQIGRFYEQVKKLIQ